MLGERMSVKGFVFVCMCERLVKDESVKSVLKKDDELWLRSKQDAYGRKKYVVMKKDKVTEEYMKRALPMCLSVRLWSGGDTRREAVEELKSKGYVCLKMQTPEYLQFKRERGWIDDGEKPEPPSKKRSFS